MCAYVCCIFYEAGVSSTTRQLFGLMRQTLLCNSLPILPARTENGGEGTQSVWRRVTRGVPQSSVLDPIMCVIYINDQPAGMKSYMSTCMFADDAKIMSRIRNVEDYNKIGN